MTVSLTQSLASLLSPAQFQDVLDFARSTVAKAANNDTITITISNALQYLRDNNATATGHSLGGGLAQYLTYATSQLSLGGTYGGIRAVTFNAVDA